MDLQKEREVFEKYCFEVLLMSPSDGHFERELEDPEFYESVDTHRLWKLWQAQAQTVPDGFVLVPHGVLDLTRFMCKTWSEIDKFVYKNCSDIGQYPVIQGTRNQLNLSRIGEQQINANEINKGVNWLLEAAQEPDHD